HGGVTETVLPGKTGWLVKVGDADAWAQAMAKAIDVGAEKRAAMGVQAAKRARQLYSNDAMCAATLAAYERVLSAREGR
ncbi:MAG TPA: glycosyltransferase, partial [Phenylobacterium sp.]|nr:glycosyltransferase [Phenylobacterium sp.]